MITEKNKRMCWSLLELFFEKPFFNLLQIPATKALLRNKFVPFKQRQDTETLKLAIAPPGVKLSFWKRNKFREEAFTLKQRH
jgi:hypothetical protein